MARRFQHRPVGVLAALVRVAIASLALTVVPSTFSPAARAIGTPISGTAATGAWSGLVDWPVIAIYAVLTPEGEVVIWGAGAGTGQGAAHFLTFGIRSSVPAPRHTA